MTSKDTNTRERDWVDWVLATTVWVLQVGGVISLFIGIFRLWGPDWVWFIGGIFGVILGVYLERLYSYSRR